MSANSAETSASAFTAALIRRDIDAALAFLTDDVVFLYSNGSAIRGKDAFAALMTASWRIVENYAYTTSNPTWILETEAAASIIYAFEWSGTAGGAAVSGAGRCTRVLSKAANGDWLIAHEHLSNGAWTL